MSQGQRRSRRSFLRQSAAATLAAAAAPGLRAAQDQGTAWVYVGTYTNGDSQGIYRFELDMASGRPAAPVLAAESTSPSFLALDPSRRHLFAVNEVDRFLGAPGGGLSAFTVDPRTGGLAPVNQQSTRGGGPCHLAVDRLGKNVLVANYGGGSVAVVPVREGGRLGPASAFVQHQGSSINPQRQKEPHAHAVVLDPAGRFAFVADLGLDKVLVYRFDPASGTLAANDPPSASVAPGAGPRHFAFHPSGRYAYVINELNSTVTAFTYDASRGALTEVQAVSTLPATYRGTNYPAEIVVHPGGRYVYGSNRGHNSIAVFAVDGSTGKLTLAGHQAEGIKNPRNFAVDPSGRWVLVANQDAASVIVFRFDPATGALAPTGFTVKVPKPVCLEFLPRAQG